MAADRVRKSIHKRRHWNVLFFCFSLRTCAVGTLARRESKISAGVLPWLKEVDNHQRALAY
jgi:hypothetical protein